MKKKSIDEVKAIKLIGQAMKRGSMSMMAIVVFFLLIDAAVVYQEWWCFGASVPFGIFAFIMSRRSDKDLLKAVNYLNLGHEKADSQNQ